MEEIEEDKVPGLLQDMEAEIKQRRAERYLKRIKKGRAVMFIIALLGMAAVIRELGSAARDMDAITMSAAITVFYFVLFIISRKYTFIPLLAATVVYALIGIYSISKDFEMFRFVFYPEVTGIQRAALGIATLVRILILFFLINGTVYARRFDALYADEA